MLFKVFRVLYEDIKMQLDDIVHVRLVGSLSTIQWSIGLYLRVLEYIGPDSVGKILSDFGSAFWDQCDQDMAPDCSLVGAIWRNQTRPEQAVVYYTGKVGTGIGESHPPHQCVRLNLYGQGATSDPIKRSSIHLPGLSEARSSDGVRTSGFYDLLAVWLQNGDIETSPTGARLNPVVRWNSGTPEVPIWNTSDVISARAKSAVMVLRRRRRGTFS